MKYGFGDFFSNIVHILVILFPGGMMLIVIWYVFSPGIDIPAMPVDGNLIFWFLVLALSFILGHIVSQLGAKWEDTDTKKKRARIAKEGKAELRALAGQIVWAQLPGAVKENERKWGAVLLRQVESPSLSVIERKDADRRFFRNIRVVFAVAAVLFFIKGITWWFSYKEDLSYLVMVEWGILTLLLLSHYRFRNQDKKYTENVFQSLVAAFPPKVSKSTQSLEIRWFNKGDIPESLEKLFQDIPVPDQWRNDYYTKTRDDETGVKWREGRIEIKIRKALVKFKNSGKEISGNLETWQKQRFESNVEPDLDELLWIRVNKKRRRMKYLLENEKLTPKKDHKKHYEGSGCAVELTEICLNEETIPGFWTLSFEVFGPEKKQWKVLEMSIDNVFRGASSEVKKLFSIKNSSGYPEWLIKEVMGK